MPVVQDNNLSPEETEAAWQLYANAMKVLTKRAAQRHLLNEIEFGEIAADKRIIKIRVHDDDGTLVGLSTFTNVLEAVPLIEPAYFAHNWPDFYRRGAIWYVGFVCARGGRQAHAYRDMIMAMYALVKPNDHTDGIVAMDYCNFNVDARQIPQITEKLLRSASPAGENVRSGEVDAQRTYVVRFDGHPVA